MRFLLLIISIFALSCTHEIEVEATIQVCPKIVWLKSNYPMTAEEQLERREAVITLCQQKYGTCPKWVRKVGPVT